MGKLRKAKKAAAAADKKVEDTAVGALFGAAWTGVTGHPHGLFGMAKFGGAVVESNRAHSRVAGIKARRKRRRQAVGSTAAFLFSLTEAGRKANRFR